MTILDMIKAMDAEVIQHFAIIFPEEEELPILSIRADLSDPSDAGLYALEMVSDMRVDGWFVTNDGIIMIRTKDVPMNNVIKALFDIERRYI